MFVKFQTSVTSTYAKAWSRVSFNLFTASLRLNYLFWNKGKDFYIMPQFHIPTTLLLKYWPPQR
jgi:hypothetical protein